MLTSLAFTNFRGFGRLELKGLKRVNLVVGRNNSGKTSLLEGIALVSDPSQFHSLPTMFRPHAGDPSKRYFRWLLRDDETVREAIVERGWDGGNAVIIFARKTSNQAHPSGATAIAEIGNLRVLALPGEKRLICRIVPVQHHSPEVLVKLFAAAVKRKGGEERIEKLLHEVDPRIVKVRIEPSEDGIHVLVDLGLSEMLPVSQVGQGIYRLIAIFSEMIGEKPDVCIIDEIENGIHHSMLEQVWTGIAAAAENLDVQVFATTHSQECIEAAHAAFVKRQTYDFSIVQLFRLEGAVQGKVLDREHIEAAMAGEIDLR